jgi:predicted amidohydrolase YtcJ
LPGLHDHHIHLLSLAAVARSVRCGPPEVTDHGGLARALRTAPPGWVRGVGYHESVAGVLDRDILDRLVSDRPVRIQHRGGALWTLNSLALRELRLHDEPAVERDDAGRPTGRLWRADPLLRARLGPQAPPDMAALGHRLASFGITGVTDATPDLTSETVALFSSLPQRVHPLGAAEGSAPYKILPADHRPPDWDELRAAITAQHARGRPVAVHAVTREALVVTLAVLVETGSLPGDRIEHAALAGTDLFDLLQRTGVVVVTQPGFIAERGDEYRRDLPDRDHPDLYRYAGLRAAGIPVVPSSDAPFASENPWHTLAAAVDRRTRDGVVLGPGERVPASVALQGMLTPLEDPGGAPRRVEPGADADLCLLHVPIAEALRDPGAVRVRATFCAGAPVYGGC